MNLIDLATKYGTDKLNHGYIPFYEKYLPKEPKRILEIGVNEGRSLQMWSNYFPDTEIHGLDLFVENDINEVSAHLLVLSGDCNNNIVLHQGNQCDWQILEELRKYDFDIIIDDGSHNSRDQLITFFGLFNGKHYFIEDLQCNDEDFYSQGLPSSMRAANLFRQLPIDGIIMDCQSPIVLISEI
jgi:hypothetical protein